MVFADFLSETRKRWLTALKLLKRSKRSKMLSAKSNRVSPDKQTEVTDELSRSYSGTVDARGDIAIERFCACRTSLPPSSTHAAYENVSFSGDSAYDSERSSPAPRVLYATVSYYHSEREDSSSVRTELTWLDEQEQEQNPSDLDQGPDDHRETTQNMLNEKIELMTSL